MTLTSEPTTLDPASLPADPAAYRQRGPGLRWWLIIIGAAIWTILTIAGTAWVMSLAKPAAPGARGIADYFAPATVAQSSPAMAAPEPAALPAPEPAATKPSSAETAALAGRIQRVEVDQRRANEAAAAALAAASLAEAARSDAPFDGELAAVSHLLPASVDLRALQRLAAQGAPTRAALSTEFADVATRAAVAARAPAKGSGLLARAAHALAGIVTIRRTDHATGDGADAVLARAQTRLENGNLEGAVAELDKLPPKAKQTIAAWRARAQRRLDIDRQVSAIRAASLRELAPGAAARP